MPTPRAIPLLNDATPLVCILTLSVTVAAPSAVVLNVNLPGISLAPGVPSTKPSILAASTVCVPSAPCQLILPNRASSVTTVTAAPAVPLDLARTN